MHGSRRLGAIRRRAIRHGPTTICATQGVSGARGVLRSNDTTVCALTATSFCPRILLCADKSRRRVFDVHRSERRLVIEHVSVSELRAFLRCRREHTYLYTLGIEPVTEAHSFVFGKLIHKALEAWWRSLGQDCLDNALDAIEAWLSARPGAIDRFDRVRVEQMIIAYHAQWGDHELEPIAAECEFVAPIVHPETGAISDRVALSGRIDALARDQRGNVWIIEHKTAQDASAGPYWERLRMDLQCAAYLFGAQALGHQAVGVLYDVIEKPRLIPLRASARRKQEDETTEVFRDRLAAHFAAHSPCQRGPVVLLEADEREARFDLWWAAHELIVQRERVNAGEKAPRTPDACFRYGRMCEFFGPCTHSGDLSDERFFRLRQANRDGEMSR